MSNTSEPSLRGAPLGVALVSDGLYPYFKGGKEVRISQLALGLVGRGHRVDLYTMAWWGRERHVRRSGVDHYAISPVLPMYVGGRRSVLQALVFAVCCLRLLTRSYDLIDADHMPYLQLFPLRLVAWVRRRPLVVTWHEFWGPDYWKQYLGRAGLLASVLERTCARLPDHIVAVSEETADRLRQVGVSPSRLTVVPNGVDGQLIERASPQCSGPDVLFCGRLLPHKGVDLLIRSLAVLAERGQRLTAAVVGEGPEEVRLKQLCADLQLQDQIRFVPTLATQEEVFSLMKSARVFVLPSVREGYGMAVAEAIACGAGVVTVDHPDNQARGLVAAYPSGRLGAPEPGPLADAILEVLSLGRASTRSEMVRDWAERAEQLAAVYERVTGR